MADAERTYTAEHVIAAAPWDVFELLVDPEQQGQWRDRWETHAPVVSDRAYTHVRFEDGLELGLEPEGSGTLLTATRTRTGEGLTGRIGLLFQSRSRVESEMEAQLKRIGASVEFGAI